MKYLFALLTVLIFSPRDKQGSCNIQFYCKNSRDISAFVSSHPDVNFTVHSTSIYFYGGIERKQSNVKFVNPNSKKVLRESYRIFVQYLEQVSVNIDSSNYSLYYKLYANCDFFSRNLNYEEENNRSVKLLELDSLSQMKLDFLSEEAMSGLNQLIDFSVQSEHSEITKGVEVKFDSRPCLVVDDRIYKYEFIYRQDDTKGKCEKRYLKGLNSISFFKCQNKKYYVLI